MPPRPIDLRKYLSGQMVGLLKRLGRAAEACNSRSFLVGGIVRDMLLDIPLPDDVDVMIEHDVLGFANFVCDNWQKFFDDIEAPYQTVKFPKYLTAKLLFQNQLWGRVGCIDLAGARKEIYLHSGAQPTVSPALLPDDLRRRDFSINAMAVEISPESFGCLWDMFEGEKDLQHRKVRILHENSFVDDPARLLRAVKMKARLEFELEAETEKKFNEGLRENYFERLPSFRRFDEFKKSLHEREIERLLDMLVESGLLAQIHPKLKISKQLRDSIRERGPRYGDTSLTWEEILLGLLEHANESEVTAVLVDFALPKKLQKRILKQRLG